MPTVPSIKQSAASDEVVIHDRDVVTFENSVLDPNMDHPSSDDKLKEETS